MARGKKHTPEQVVTLLRQVEVAVADGKSSFLFFVAVRSSSFFISNMIEIISVPASTTTQAMERIGALYLIEDQIRGKPEGLRREVRQTRARPLLDEFEKWMEKSLRSLSPKSETAGAIRYALSRWRALTRYVDDGHLETDNSAAERALRAVALGPKSMHTVCHQWNQNASTKSA
jgi:hypothetical protein